MVLDRTKVINHVTIAQWKISLKTISKKPGWQIGPLDRQTGGFMYQEMTKPNPHDPINTLCRKDQSTIFQLRTGHTKFNAHLNRINPQVAPVCRGCDFAYETVHHVLFDCKRMSKYKKKLLPAQPTLGNVLYGNKAQLENTVRFVNLSLTIES